MEQATLKQLIQKNEVPNFLAFTGEEWAAQKIYIDQIVKRYKLEKRYIDTVYEVLPKLGNKKFITSHNYLYLVRDDNKILTDFKCLDKLQQLLGNNILILLITKLDKRTKFASTYKDSIIEFNPLNPVDLKKYIKKEITLSDNNCDKLIEVCEGNYGRILLEIDKIKHYDAGVSKTHEEAELWDLDFKSLLADGTIYTPPKDAIFDLVDAILDRKTKLTFDLLEQCKAINESSFAILTVLFNNAKAILQVQTCKNTNITKSTGLTGWQIMNAKKHLNTYTNTELQNMLKLLSNVVHGVKIGTIEERYVLDYVLARILG